MMSVSGWLRQITNMTLAAFGRGSMITCEEALAAMHEFLDGEAPPDAQDRVRAHFDACGRCYPRLRIEESFRSAVRLAVQGEAAPEDLKNRLRALLDREAGA